MLNYLCALLYLADFPDSDISFSLFNLNKCLYNIDINLYMGVLYMILNYFKVRNLICQHKQFEKRDGRMYMRLKKRPIVIIREKESYIPNNKNIGIVRESLY